MTEQEWLSCTEPNELLREVGRFPHTERKLICAMLAFANLSSNKPDKVALELTGTMAKYAGGIRISQQLVEHFEAAMRGNGIDVTFDYGEMVLFFREAFRSGVKLQTLVAPIRDIFGNPFCPVSIDPSWLSWHDGLLVSMAQQMYDSRDFTDLPVLADALEEAGCQNQDILNHCRSGGEHFRGCWVVDLILGKS